MNLKERTLTNQRGTVLRYAILDCYENSEINEIWSLCNYRTLGPGSNVELHMCRI